MFFQRKHQSELERKLRRRRPRADEALVDEIAAHIEGHQPASKPHSLRVAFAVASLGIITALAAFGGVSYAASGVQHAAVAVKHVFVPKQAKPVAKPSAAPDVLGSLQPGKTSAADQYLPPGITPLAALTSFSQYVVKANQDLQSALNCGAKSGRARTACTNHVNALKARETADQTALNAAIAKLATLSPTQQALIGTLLAIHLLQQQKLAAGQTTRTANCADATFKSAHKAICAKTGPVAGATERLKLGHLQLAELNALLAAV
jgi:hypothetical protein